MAIYRRCYPLYGSPHIPYGDLLALLYPLWPSPTRNIMASPPPSVAILSGMLVLTPSPGVAWSTHPSSSLDHQEAYGKTHRTCYSFCGLYHQDYYGLERDPPTSCAFCLLPSRTLWYASTIRWYESSQNEDNPGLDDNRNTTIS